MEQISLKIGERLKEIRNTRQLTLDDVAELTGVSKPMLGQIERGQSSPTINVLWKISTGLKIPLSFFCRQQEAEYTLAGLDKEDAITEENGGMRAYPLFPFDPVRNLEAFYIEFDAGVRHESLPHVAGVEENMSFWCRERLQWWSAKKKSACGKNSPYGLGPIFPMHITMFQIKPAPPIM